MASDDRSLCLRLPFAFWDGKNAAVPLQRWGGGSKQNSACCSATLLLMFLSQPQSGLLVFTSSGLRFLASVRQDPPGSFIVQMGGPDVVLGGSLHQDSSALTVFRRSKVNLCSVWNMLGQKVFSNLRSACFGRDACQRVNRTLLPPHSSFRFSPWTALTICHPTEYVFVTSEWPHMLCLTFGITVLGF